MRKIQKKSQVVSLTVISFFCDKNTFIFFFQFFRFRKHKFPSFPRELAYRSFCNTLKKTRSTCFIGFRILGFRLVI